MKLTRLLIRKKCKSCILLFLMCFFSTVFSQKIKHYTLNELIHLAYVNYPYAGQLNLTKRQNDESEKNINTVWLPQVSVSGKTTYQSEVYSFSMPESVVQQFGLSLSTPEKLQYQGQACVSQLIYDGGISNTQKKLTEINSDIQTDQIKSSMLQVEDNVNALFESILINKEQIKINKFQQKDLELRKKEISYAIQNGISLKTDLQEIDADVIQLKQQEISLLMKQCQDFVQLSSFTRLHIDTTSVLYFPQQICKTDDNYTSRPDYMLFGKQIQSSEYQLMKLKCEFIPQVSAFANGYCGRPGLNVMDYSTHFSGIVGVSLNWNISSLYDNIHKKKLVNINIDLVKNNQLIYEINMNRQIENLKIDLLKNKDLMNSDDDIVSIRSNVKDVAATQLKNGSITLTDYLIKLNDVSQAMINKSIHKIEFSMDGAKMRTLLNKNN